MRASRCPPTALPDRPAYLLAALQHQGEVSLKGAFPFRPQAKHEPGATAARGLDADREVRGGKAVHLRLLLLAALLLHLLFCCASLQLQEIGCVDAAHEQQA